MRVVGEQIVDVQAWGYRTPARKQIQFVPMTAAEINTSLRLGARVYLDKVATKDMLRFESLWLEHVKNARASVLEKTMARKQFTDSIESGLRSSRTSTP